MKVIRDSLGAAAMAGLLALSNPVVAAQPAMEAALASLEQAKTSLQNATIDKGGHRVKAIKAVEAAIAEVRAGIEFDRTHTGPNEGKKAK